MKNDYDIAVIGSGYGGSLLALVARRLGLSVLLLEKGRHPRFAVGESTSPLANLLLEQLAHEYDLPRLMPLTSHGPWQRNYPQVAHGLKRGFTYFHHTQGREYDGGRARENQLLVAASPDDERADTHWLRADVDQFLVNEARDAGADYWDGVAVCPPQWDAGGPATLTGEQQGVPFTTQARLIIDATGPRGFLSRALGLPEVPFADYPRTQALYSHFTGVRRCDTMREFCSAGSPPYPLDDAAVHHVFNGGWMWALRVGGDVTSAGIAVTDALALELGLADGEPAWQRLLARFPSVARQFAEAQAVQPFVHAPRLAYRASVAAGPGWALLPSAAAFVDPLFSTGIPLTLLGIERLGRIFRESWGSADLGARLADYSRVTLAEAESTADFIGACYAAMPRFDVFSTLSMFYFAAASYSEIARRTGRGHLVTRFLAADHPEFGPALRASTARVREAMRGPGPSPDIQCRVAEAIACLNVAGLCDPSKRNWYGVDLNDVVRGADKLGLTPEEMRDILRTAPWAQPTDLWREED